MGEHREPTLAASVARAAGRLSSDKALRKRLFRASFSGVTATLGALGRVLQKLWHEVTGFLFICLAVIGAAQVWRKWESHETKKLAVAGAFAVMFLYFGVSSFWRARRPKPNTKKKDTNAH